MNVCLYVPYRSPHRSSDCDETLTSYCKHVRGGFRNLENVKIVAYYLEYPVLPYISILIRSSDCNKSFTSCCKHYRVGFGNLKNLKIVLAGVLGVAFSLQKYTPFVRLQRNSHKLS